MHPLFLIPTAFLSFLTGAAFGFGKKKDGKLGKSLTSPGSPFPGIPVAAWERFVAVMVVAPKTHISPKGKLGTFQMDARRLKDVGLMTKASKKPVPGQTSGVWMGQWREPLTTEDFLGSMPLQYAAFVRSCKRAAAAPEVSESVGVEVDGRKCSLSGLLGVAHAAGQGAVAGWVVDPKVRHRFTVTTEAFTRTNGIF